ncbi:MAG: STAS domain-containing protein [Methylococcales bacterium]|jgi:anti-anti-sigma regulatory factor|nr:STAS domain-containing protein [Methylococcales bacterium]MBT7444473.1 STAS domain-containing protein [Methylococcales bacterium]
MGITTFRHNTQLTIYLLIHSSTLDGRLIQEFRDSYANIDNITEYLIDLENVQHIDSAIMGLLLVLYGEMKEQKNQATLKIINAAPHILDILLNAKINEYYEIV